MGAGLMESTSYFFRGERTQMTDSLALVEKKISWLKFLGEFETAITLGIKPQFGNLVFVTLFRAYGFLFLALLY